MILTHLNEFNGAELCSFLHKCLILFLLLVFYNWTIFNLFNSSIDTNHSNKIYPINEIISSKAAHKRTSIVCAISPNRLRPLKCIFARSSAIAIYFVARDRRSPFGQASKNQQQNEYKAIYCTTRSFSQRFHTDVEVRVWLRRQKFATK